MIHYFTKIAKASHEPDNSVRNNEENGEKFNLVLASLLAEFKKQNPTNERPIKDMFLACFVICYELIPVRCKRLVSGYQASKYTTIFRVPSVNQFNQSS